MARSIKSDPHRVRYAVVGLGYIAQVAVLPAFKRAAENSELTALVSGDSVKLKRLGRKYGVEDLYSYEEYEDCLASGRVDAVYIALPNSMHCEFAVRAARAGIHVLCEKPMAVTVEECERMIEAAEEGGVRLMIAYRLHFEQANLKAIEIARGQLGDLRIFNSVFSMSVKPDDIRVRRDLGGGPTYDIGIYCINAARYLFQDEPYEVWATSASGEDDRFSEVPEMVSAILRFPQERIVSFTCSFGAADVSAFELVGTLGHLRVDPAYEYAEALRHELVIRGRSTSRNFPRRDQFGPELIYFSDCLLRSKVPEPSGEEGLADVQIIEAIRESCHSGACVPLHRLGPVRHPHPRQAIFRRAIRKPELVHARSPTEDLT